MSLYVAASALTLALRASASADGVDVRVDWAAFLSRSDPVNNFSASQPMTVPDVWLEGSFAGNGLVGAQVLVCPAGICRQSLLLGANTSEPPTGPLQVVVPLARGDVGDVRTGTNAVTCNPTAPPPYNVCGVSERIAQPRLGIGDLILSKTRGAIVSGSIRTHLHNGTIVATLQTTQGALSFSLFVHAERQLVVVQGLRGSGGEANTPLQWEFRPAPALPPGLFKETKDGEFTKFTGAPPPANYTLNPHPVCTGSSCRQVLLASPDGRGWATAWRSVNATAIDHDTDGGSSLLLAIACDLPRPAVPSKTTRAIAEANAAVAAAAGLGLAALMREHSRWWASYYWSDDSGAFLSLPTAEAANLEQFHWITVYAHHTHTHTHTHTSVSAQLLVLCVESRYKVGAENACRQFKDSAWSPSYRDNCVLLDGINGPLSVSKTKWSNGRSHPQCHTHTNAHPEVSQRASLSQQLHEASTFDVLGMHI